MVRANRYALAAALGGEGLQPWVRAIHGCNNPPCVRVSSPGDTGLLHPLPGTQRDNMVMMARAARGGGRVVVRRGGHGVKARRARTIALREAVRDGWDGGAVAAALLGSQDPTLWLHGSSEGGPRPRVAGQRPRFVSPPDAPGVARSRGGDLAVPCRVGW